MKTKVGLCGYGPMGRMHAQLLNRIEQVELVGIAEVQEELRAQAGEELGVKTWASGEEMIDAQAAEAIYVVTPTFLHGPLAIRALEQGMHVFTEKPMGLDPGICDAMIEAADRNGKLLTVGQVLRFWPEYAYLKNALSDGRFGPLQTLSMTRVGGVSHGWRNWYLDEKLGGTQIFDRHIHDTDVCVWLFGVPTAVSAYGTDVGEGGFRHSFTRYIYAGPMSVSAEGSADLVGNYPFTMGFLAVFERGAIEYSNRNKPTLMVYSDDGEPTSPDLPDPLGDIQVGLNISSAGAYYLEDVYFIDCIQAGRRPEIVTPDSARETVRVVRAEIESARTGSPVTLD